MRKNWPNYLVINTYNETRETTTPGRWNGQPAVLESRSFKWRIEKDSDHIRNI